MLAAEIQNILREKEIIKNQVNQSHLVRRVVLKSWKFLLLAVSAHIGVVSSVSLLNSCNRQVLNTSFLTEQQEFIFLTSVVGDVLPLGVDPVELLVDGLGGVVTILPDDTLGLVQELVCIQEELGN